MTGTLQAAYNLTQPRDLGELVAFLSSLADGPEAFEVSIRGPWLDIHEVTR